ncbi:MAG: hypothetical protein QF614_00375 [SAR324 cluster bacterium]|jgi:hypothetical protein|nr:hypothetical protein [Arenicellales bacterium]MDP7462928.1 hypothetical protein [SAR324 cluster bacterium]
MTSRRKVFTVLVALVLFVTLSTACSTKTEPTPVPVVNWTDDEALAFFMEWASNQTASNPNTPMNFGCLETLLRRRYTITATAKGASEGSSEVSISGRTVPSSGQWMIHFGSDGHALVYEDTQTVSLENAPKIKPHCVRSIK